MHEAVVQDWLVVTLHWIETISIGQIVAWS
jgi:hypothetical protein